MQLTTNYQVIGETFCGSHGAGNVYLRLYAKYSSQSIINNQTQVQLQSRIYVVSGYFTTTSINSNIDGISLNIGTINFRPGETVLQTIERTIPHQGDGTSGIITKVCSWSSYWSDLNGSTSGSFTLPTIPRYASCNHSLNFKAEKMIKMNWSSDSTIDFVWYSKDNGVNWIGVGNVTGTSGIYTITGLNPNSTYNVKTRVRRKDSQLTTDSSSLSITTYNSARVTSVNDFVIGDSIPLQFYNPLNRTMSVQLIVSGTTITTKNVNGTSYNLTLNQAEQDQLYSKIPNSPFGSFLISCSTTEGGQVNTGTHTFRANTNLIKPIFNKFTYIADHTNLTNNNQVVINNQSIITFQISASNKAVGVKSATIKKYRCEWGSKIADVNYATTDVIAKVEKGNGNVLKVTAIDSRGQETTVSITLSGNLFVAYERPQFLEVNATRKNGVEAETYLNAKLKIWNKSFGTVTNGLALLFYQCKKKNEDYTYTSYTNISQSDMTFAEDGTITVTNALIHAQNGSGGFEVGVAYDIQLIIRDKLATDHTNDVYTEITLTDGKFATDLIKINGEYKHSINGLADPSATEKIYGNLDVLKEIKSMDGRFVNQFQGEVKDFNQATSQGEYLVFGKNINNAPYTNEIYGKLAVMVSDSKKYNGSNNWIWQQFIDISGREYKRFRVNNGSWKIWKNKLDDCYPIGSVYISVKSTNPSTLFGGTWVAWGTGRVPVGINTSQTQFNTIEKIGGSMDMQNHFHNGLFVDGTPLKFAGGGNQSAGNTFQGIQLNGPNMIYTASTGTGNSGNLQPYITCYMWKRTA